MINNDSNNTSTNVKINHIKNNSENIEQDRDIFRRTDVNTVKDKEKIHLILPPIFTVQVKSGACYITGHWGRVQKK